MIVIHVELWKWGNPEFRAQLGSAKIFNDLSGMGTSGNYGYEIFNKAGRSWKKGKIKGFPRKRLLVWDLLFRALRNAIGERNECSNDQAGADQRLLSTMANS